MHFIVFHIWLVKDWDIFFLFDMDNCFYVIKMSLKSEQIFFSHLHPYLVACWCLITPKQQNYI